MKRAIKRLQALFLVLAMCTSVLQATALAADTSDTEAHTYQVVNVTFDEDGNYTADLKCIAQGHTDQPDPIKGKYDSKEETPPTCEEPAYIIYKVTLDKDKVSSDKKVWEQKFEVQGKPAEGHQPVDEVKNITAPTCTTYGSYRIDRVCSVCGKTISEGKPLTSPKVPHDWENKTDADGKDYKECKVCGTIVYPHTHVADTALDEPVIENVKSPTCKEEGSHDEVVYCKECNEEISRNTIKDPAAHTPATRIEEKSRVKPTCTKEGSHVEITYCSVCTKELSRQTVTDPKTEHTRANKPVYENDTATCQTGGTKDEVYKCVSCGAELSREKVPSNAKDHDYADPVKENIVKPTCTRDGSYESVVYCKIGGEEKSREKVIQPKIPHDVKPAIVWDAYETALYGPHDMPDVEVWEQCSVCGWKDVDYVRDCYVKEDTSKYVAPGEHSCQPGSKTFDARYVYKDKDGKEVVLTDSKTFKFYNTYNGSEHTPGPATIENKVEPTCTEDGKYDVVVKCTVCGDIISSVPGVTGKTGHVPGKVVIENAKDATCTAAGSHDEVIYCSDCGEELSRKTVEDAAIAHTPGEAVKENVTDTSYDEVVKCSVCGEEISRKTVTTEKPADPEPTKPEPEKPHTHTPAKAVKENVVKATYAKAGSYTLVVRCSECGEVISTTQKVTAKKKVPGTTLKSVKNVKGKKIKATWKKVSGINGYQVQYCLNKSFMNTKTFQTTGTTKTMTGLKKNKKYYVRARTYKRVGGKVYFAKWSAPKSVKIKK